MHIPATSSVVSALGNSIAQSRGSDGEKQAAAAADRGQSPGGQQIDSVETVSKGGDTADRSGDGHGYEADRKKKRDEKQEDASTRTSRAALSDGSGQLLDLDA